MYTRYISNKIYLWFIFDDDGNDEFALILFFPMFLFDPRKTKKTFGFLMFLGGSKGNIGKQSEKADFQLGP